MSGTRADGGQAWRGSVLRVLRAKSDDLHAAERRVAGYVLAAPDKVIYQSISEVAENAGVSEPTVIRFCRALGLKGYHDLKIHLAQDLVFPRRRTSTRTWAPGTTRPRSAARS